MGRKAIIIGAGAGGLATALRLKKEGWDVTVFESSDAPGGKIREIHHKGFRFDTGPSLLTLPHLVKDLFRLYNENPDDHLSMYRLKNITRYFFEDGTLINAWQNPLAFASEIEEKTGEKARHVIRYLEDAEKLYELTSNTFIFKPFSTSRIFSKDFLKAGLQFRKLNAFQSMHQVNERYFSDSRLIRIFDRYATYNGSDPYQAPGTLAVISHLEHNTGAFFPKQGMYSFVQSLCDFAKHKDITFSFNDPVESIIFKNNTAKGVIASSGEHNSDIVISNADVFHTWDKLLKEKEVPAKLLRQERSSSALIFYWGVNGIHEKADVHNILFTENYREEFRHLFSLKNIYDDPTVYVFISSKAVKTDAPDGMENWFVMINVPADHGQKWDEMIKRARENIIRKINRMLNIKIEQKIVFEKMLDPRGIEKNTSSYQGALYGNSSNSRFSAFLRQSNKSSVKNLYFTGGSVHPGGGIPLCLASAAITVDAIKKSHS